MTTRDTAIRIGHEQANRTNRTYYVIHCMNGKQIVAFMRPAKREQATVCQPIAKGAK